MGIFEIIAALGTLGAVIFVILALFGLDDAFDGWFVQRAIISSGVGFGWVGILMRDAGFSEGWVVTGAIAAGLVLAATMALVAVLMKKMGDHQPASITTLAGQPAEVTAVDHSTSSLMVRALFQDRLQEFPARFVSAATSSSVKAGDIVMIKEVTSVGTLVVESP